MGLLDGVLGGGSTQMQSHKSPGFGETALAGLALALLVKGLRSQQAHEAQAQAQARAGAPGAASGGGLGGLGAILGGGGLGGLLGGGGAMGGGGLGGLIGALGGAGGLGALLGKLQGNGFGQHADSWVGTGPNQPIAPNQLADALGPDAVQELQQRTGLPRDQLLSQLSHELPAAIDQVTPEGRLPTDAELQQIAQRA